MTAAAVILCLLTADPPPSLPPLWARDHFPDVKATRDALDFNYRFREHCERRRQWQRHRWDAWSRQIGEAHRINEIWQILWDAHEGTPWTSHEGDYGGPDDDPAIEGHRREALGRLRDLIGWAAFDRGEMPAYVPVGNFEAIP